MEKTVSGLQNTMENKANVKLLAVLESVSPVISLAPSLIRLNHSNTLDANTTGAKKVGATTSELRRMVVSPNFRRRGIAQKLIKRAIEHARERGVEHIYLTTLSYQAAAVKMYLKLNWEVKKHYKPTILFDKLWAYELLLDVNTCNL